MKHKRFLTGLLAAVMLMAAVPAVSAEAHDLSYECYRLRENYREMGSLNTAELTLYTGETFQLKLTGAKVTKWRSSRKGVATVSKNGLVTAKSPGEINVVAYISDTESYVCHVTVKAPELSKTLTSMYIGTKQKLEIYGTKAKKWASSNKKVVMWDSGGRRLSTK